VARGRGVSALPVDFADYIALGDSMSIDLFPALDAGATDVAVALERDPTVGAVAPLGAASLFFRNDEEHWPDESGADLDTRFPGIRFTQLASHGATIGDVFGEQVAAIPFDDAPSIITLTIGSEDLFSAFSSRPPRALMDRIVADLCEAYELLLGAIGQARPGCVILATTVCDPSDRLGRIPGVLDDVGRLPLGAMDTFNAQIRTLASSMPNVLLADAYLRFLGHGASVDEADRWFWRRSPLEPNKQGAHELRIAWLEALREAQGA
jgi:hypothetical protein